MTQERETMELDVLFIGAGVANLCAALQLKKAVDAWNEKAKAQSQKPLDDPMILVIDKGKKVGNHTLSGAVVDPVAFKEMFPELGEKDFPFVTPVAEEGTYQFTKTGAWKFPPFLVPKEMQHHGCHIASICEITRWLAKKCEEAGIEIYTEFAADALIKDGDKVIGARIADKGLDHEGKPGENFTPGMDLLAKVTVIGEGTRGFLATQLIKDHKLDAGRDPQIWSVGVKELIDVPAGQVKKGSVLHGTGYPVPGDVYGGFFAYALSDTQVAVGLAFALDYEDPYLNTHELFLRLKSHPMIAKLIAGGEVKEYGAKTLPEAGWYAIPKLSVDGAVLVGDSAGLLNCMRLKGIHLAMKSGLLAGERVCQALVTGDTSAARLDYRGDFDASWAGKELQSVRNFRANFHGGWIGMQVGKVFTGLHGFTGGAITGFRKTLPPDFKSLKPKSGFKPMDKSKTDGKLNLYLETDVFKSGAIHREEQPAHCKIVSNEACLKCMNEFAAPCTRFCPAKVYEEQKDAAGVFTGIHVSFSNCVHCKTCEIKDPLENIKWTPPEGGDGPKYNRM
ncbi:MAG: electron-transfer flavoprotein:ubiquinone oxidoreductase [Candidatus Sumerlaeota bacterium]|nr:electron-transfer flavoprotein:ubiquinone oxidoreductase [Candidatus Sumerlaeota bacterium]